MAYQNSLASYGFSPFQFGQPVTKFQPTRSDALEAMRWGQMPQSFGSPSMGMSGNSQYNETIDSTPSIITQLMGGYAPTQDNPVNANYGPNGGIPEEYAMPSETINVVGERPGGMWDKIKNAFGGLTDPNNMSDYGMYGVTPDMKSRALRSGISNAGRLLTQAAFAPSWQQAGPALSSLLPQAIGGYEESLDEQSKRAIFNEKLGMELEKSGYEVAERKLKLAEAMKDWDDDQGIRAGIGDMAKTMETDYLDMLGVTDVESMTKTQKALYQSFKAQTTLMQKVPTPENFNAAMTSFQELAKDVGMEELAGRKYEIIAAELAAKAGYGGDVEKWSGVERSKDELEIEKSRAQIAADRALANQRSTGQGGREAVTDAEILALTKALESGWAAIEKDLIIENRKSDGKQVFAAKGGEIPASLIDFTDARGNLIGDKIRQQKKAAKHARALAEAILLARQPQPGFPSGVPIDIDKLISMLPD